VSVAGVDLLYLGLQLVLSSVETLRRLEGGVGGRRFTDQALEPPRINRLLRQPQGVAGSGARDHCAAVPRRAVRLETPPQVGDVCVQGAGRVGRRTLTPQRVHQLLRRDHITASDHQASEYRSRAASTDVNGDAVAFGAQRPEDRHAQVTSVRVPLGLRGSCRRHRVPPNVRERIIGPSRRVRKVSAPHFPPGWAVRGPAPRAYHGRIARLHVRGSSSWSPDRTRSPTSSRPSG
jgi:hypothetical protein